MSLRSRILASGIPEAIALLPETVLAGLLQEAARRSSQTEHGFLWEVRNVFKEQSEAMTGFDGLVALWSQAHFDLQATHGYLVELARAAFAGTPVPWSVETQVTQLFIDEVLTYHPVWGLELTKSLEPWGVLKPTPDERGWGKLSWYRDRRHPQQSHRTQTVAEVFLRPRKGGWEVFGSIKGVLVDQEAGEARLRLYSPVDRLYWFRHPLVRADVSLQMMLLRDQVDQRLVDLGYHFRS